MGVSAPIVLFVYHRPEHTRRLLRSLAANPAAREARFYVFSDGPRSTADVPLVHDVRRLLREESPCRSMVIREQETNRGLAGSIVAGVSEVIEEHGQAIVLEDDLELSPFFLDFMNEALERYRDRADVMQISGYAFPLKLSPARPAFFLPLISSWGWATWGRAWRHLVADFAALEQLGNDAVLRRRFDLDGSYPFYDLLERQAKGAADSWAVRWYLSVFLHGGLTLFPSASLVRNRGWDGSGVHCTRGTDFDVPLARTAAWTLPELVSVDEEAYARLQAHFRRVVPPITVRPSLITRVWRRLARMLVGGARK